MRIMLLAAALGLTSSLCAPQLVEIGGSAAGCVGSDGSGCGGGTHPMVSGHAAWWATDRSELTLEINDRTARGL